MIIYSYVRTNWLISSQVDEGTPPEPEGSFVDYQTTMVKFSKAIAITAQEMVSALMHWDVHAWLCVFSINYPIY